MIESLSPPQIGSAMLQPLSSLASSRLTHQGVPPSARARGVVGGLLLRLIAATALATDALVHVTNARYYDLPHGLLTEGNLFRAEALVAGAAALFLLARPTPRIWTLTFVVAASALAGVLVYRYVDIGAIGPFPNLYEPSWQPPGKILSALGEGAASLLSGLGLALAIRRPAAR